MRATSLLPILVLGACTPDPVDSGDPADTGDPRVRDPAAPFALLELFTSEGCSSCPPADDNLAVLLEERAGERVFGMAWHVDYWDYLGWTDPFGDPAWSQRQYDYATAWGAGGVYTPQMVSNGIDEFVGSSHAAAVSALEDGLETPVSTGVTLWALDSSTPEAIQVDYEVLEAAAGTTLHVVLVESGLVSEVTAGENRGSTLEHENVVRTWVQAETGTGRVELPVPEGVVLANTSLVGWVQDDATLAIVGATSAEVPAE